MIKVLVTDGGIRVITVPASRRVLIGGVGAPGISARTGASLNFEGPWANGQEIGGYIVPGNDQYIAAFCAAYTALAPSSNKSITITKNGSPFAHMNFLSGNGVPTFVFSGDGRVVFRDLIQFYAPDPADAGFSAASILYVLLAGR